MKKRTHSKNFLARREERKSLRRRKQVRRWKRRISSKSFRCEEQLGDDLHVNVDKRDIILVEAPEALEDNTSKDFSETTWRIGMVWQGVWVSCFMPVEEAKKVEPGKPYFTISKRGNGLKSKPYKDRKSWSMNVQKMISLQKANEMLEQAKPRKERSPFA